MRGTNTQQIKPRTITVRPGRIWAKALMGVALLGIAGGVWAAFGPTPWSDGGDRDITPVDMAVARVQSFDIVTTASGELEARNQIEIRSELESSSSIVEIVDEGERVRKGDLLIRLNTDELRNQIEEEQLRVESAKADFEAAETSYQIQVSENASRRQQAELKLELANLALAQWEMGDVAKRREQNRIGIEKAVRDLNRLKERVERSERLYGEGFLSKDELERDRISLEEARAAEVIAKLEHEIYENYTHERDRKTRSSDVEEAEAELARVIEQNEINLRSRESTKNNRLRQLQLREQRLANLEAQVEAAHITAPSDGLVVHSTSLQSGRRGNDEPLQIGRQVRPNELLIVLPEVSQMMASVRVHESLAGRLRRGLSATVRVDAGGGMSYNGQVQSIGVLPETGGWRDPNRREYTVRIAIEADNDDELLKPSMRCEAEIVLGRVEDAVSVPVQAVFSDGPVRYVYTPQGSRFARVPVETGRRSDTMVEITKGIEANQTVLLRRPRANEVLPDRWDEQQLAAVGFHLDESGQPVPIAVAEARGSAVPAQPEATPQREARQGQRRTGRPQSTEAQRQADARPATPETGDAAETDEAATESTEAVEATQAG